MATTNIAYATTTSITITPGALADGSARQSTAVDNSSNLYVDAMVELYIKAGTTLSGDSAVYCWFYASEDGTNFTHNASGTDGAYTMKSPNALIGPFVALLADTSTDHYFVIPSVANYFGGILPREWGIVLENQSGSALTTGSTANYTGITFTSA